MSTLKELSSTEYCSLYYNFRNSRTIEYLRFMKNEMNFYKKKHTGVIVTLGFFPPVVYRYSIPAGVYYWPAKCGSRQNVAQANIHDYTENVKYLKIS
jgi:hypothetical protein